MPVPRSARPRRRPRRRPARLGGDRRRLGEVGLDGSRPRPRSPPAPLLQPAVSRRHGGLTVDEIYKHDAPGVAFIQATRSRRSRRPPSTRSARSGGGDRDRLRVRDRHTTGHILTNAHVVDGARRSRSSSAARTASRSTRRWSARTTPPTSPCSRSTPPPTAAPAGARRLVRRPASATRSSRSATRSASTAPSTAGIVSALQRQIRPPTASRSTT